MLFKDLSIAEPLLRALGDEGYEKPTPIQEQAIPYVLQKRDLLGCAQTGTGKTAAFAIPLLQLMSQTATNAEGRKSIRALVLTPTRELAIQIQESFEAYGRYLSLKPMVIFGGVSQYQQVAGLRRGVDILVATPGRLLDLMNQGHVSLNNIEYFVLDEADRMLDMGFMPDVERICNALPEDRQTLLFSATLDGVIGNLATRMLKNPKTIQIAAQKEKHANIEQRLHFVDDMNHKNKLLEHLLIGEDVNQAIVFTSTKRHADLLAEDLYAAGHKTAALHGDMTQGARNRTLTKLRHGDIRVLVATDVAARGIDVHGITHVINYDLPKFAEDYVHRIGRTGRAGNMGVAVSFASHADRYQVRKIEQFTGQRIEPSVIEGFEPKRPPPRMDNDRPRNGRKPNGGYKGRGGFRGDNRTASQGQGFNDRRSGTEHQGNGRGHDSFGNQKRNSSGRNNSARRPRAFG